MCGILAVVDYKKTIEKGLLFDITSTLNHRGPDATGVWQENNISLGVCRLRVHDNSTRSDQPFFSECGNFSLIFNGAIYNFRILRDMLVKEGIRFETNSDTEVLLKGLIEYGSSFINKIDGMFAGVFLDRNKQQITIFRDYAGIKPLYIYKHNSTLIVSSEIKAILKYPGVIKEFNHHILPEYFSFHYVQPPDTFFKNIEVFMPGTVMEVNLSFGHYDYSTYKYWEINSEFLEKDIPASVEEILIKNISNCWYNDRKTGIQLSGGVDSSLITALSYDKLETKEIDTYSVIFNDDEIKYYLPRSEETYIDTVVNKFECNSNKYLFKPEEIKIALPKAIYHMESPILGASTSLYYLLASKIKEDVTVLLTGEGADDIFLGYWNNIPINNDMRKNIIPFVPLEYVQNLFDLNNYRHPFDKKVEYFNSSSLKGMTNGQKISAYTINSYLHGLLARHDRMFMAHGIEGRPPFISRELIEKRFTMDDSEIHDGTNGKLNLKKFAGQYFDDPFLYRKKIGFSSPYGDWSSDDRYWRSYWKLINEEMLAEYMDINYMNSFLNLQDSKDKWSGAKLNLLFVLLNFQIWYSIFIDSDLNSVLSKTS